MIDLVPINVDPLLGKIVIRLHHDWPDKNRQKLNDLIPFMAGTRGSIELTSRRSWFILDRIVRWHFPSLLRDLPTRIVNVDIESLSPITDEKSAFDALALLRIVGQNLGDSPVAYSLVRFAYYADFAYFAYGIDAAISFVVASEALAASASAYVAASYAASYALAYDDTVGRIFRNRSCDRMVAILRKACVLTDVPGAQ